MNTTVCVFAKHDGSDKEYIFAVPEHLQHQMIRKGDILLVDTKRGLQVATATSDFFESSDAENIAVKFGAYLPLKEVRQVCGKEIQEYLEKKLMEEVQSSIKLMEEAQSSIAQFSSALEKMEQFVMRYSDELPF